MGWVQNNGGDAERMVALYKAIANIAPDRYDVYYYHALILLDNLAAPSETSVILVPCPALAEALAPAQPQPPP